MICTTPRPRPPEATPTKERRECVELRQQLLGRLPQPRDQTSPVEFVIFNQVLDGGEPVLVGDVVLLVVVFDVIVPHLTLVTGGWGEHFRWGGGRGIGLHVDEKVTKSAN